MYSVHETCTNPTGEKVVSFTVAEPPQGDTFWGGTFQNLGKFVFGTPPTSHSGRRRKGGVRSVVLTLTPTIGDHVTALLALSPKVVSGGGGAMAALLKRRTKFGIMGADTTDCTRACVF